MNDFVFLQRARSKAFFASSGRPWYYNLGDFHIWLQPQVVVVASWCKCVYLISAWAKQHVCVCGCISTCHHLSPTNHPLRMWAGLSASVRHHTHMQTHIPDAHIQFDMCHLLWRDQAAIHTAQYLHNLPPQRLCLASLRIVSVWECECVL